MDERRHRRIYIAHSLLLGLPGLIAGAGVAGFALYMFLTRLDQMRDDEYTLLFLWAAAGLAGAAGWVWLSWQYLRHGREGLRRAPPLPWIGLVLGVLAALGIAGLVLFAMFHGSPWQVLGYLLLGPPVLLPAAHLAWLRWRPGRLSGT
ncbi:hypothetical protein [Stenotrophomonas sp.]|uniref:hypothetical protein n=1 Tax=Stenotrophomonas sp. TaxID=69392 RepID=UPI0028A8D52F|nr:hypothetical protein [Stenotrophomonas sp.]